MHTSTTYKNKRRETSLYSCTNNEPRPSDQQKKKTARHLYAHTYTYTFSVSHDIWKIDTRILIGLKSIESFFYSFGSHQIPKTVKQHSKSENGHANLSHCGDGFCRCCCCCCHAISFLSFRFLSPRIDGIDRFLQI